MKQEAIQTEEYRGYTISTYLDDYPVNPRTDCDNFGHMICFHRRYDLGDEHDMSVKELQEIVARKDVIALHLFLYDHSGITISTSRFSDPWDSGQVGYIYVTYEEIKKEHSVKRVTKAIREKVIKLLDSEVNIYDSYIRGDVYGYVVENDRGESIDSCWGFFGREGIEIGIQEAKSAIDYDIEKEREQNAIDHIVEVGEDVSVA